MCFTEACSARQRAFAITWEERDRRRKVARQRVLFMPTPKQAAYAELTRQRKYTVFGGAKAVAKSHALRWLAYRECMRIPGLRVLLLRRTYGELEKTHLLEMPLDAERLRPAGAEYKSGAREFHVGDGSLIVAGHCETDADLSKFLSTQWDVVIFDELVTFLLMQFLAIVSCARTVKATLIAEGGAKVWAATNPGGRGAHWVKEWFVDRVVDAEQYPAYRPEEWGAVLGTVDDNPYVEPGYKQTLMNLPPMLRRQWLEGDWEAFEGQFFDWQAQRGGGPWHVADLGLVA